MVGQEFTTTANYADTNVDPDREVTFIISTNEPTFMQTARINQKDGSRIWDTDDIPLPPCDITLSKVAGVRFKTNGATPATVFVMWTYDRDDLAVDKFSTNGPFDPADPAELTRTLAVISGRATAGNVNGGALVYLLGTAVTKQADTNPSFTNYSIKAADLAIPGHTTKLRLVAQASVNDTAIAADLEFGLYPVTAMTGGVTVLNPNLGAVIPASKVTFLAPAANSISAEKDSGDFALPADGLYSVAMHSTASFAANSAAAISARLEARYSSP